LGTRHHHTADDSLSGVDRNGSATVASRSHSTVAGDTRHRRVRARVLEHRLFDATAHTVEHLSRDGRSVFEGIERESLWEQPDLSRDLHNLNDQTTADRARAQCYLPGSRPSALEKQVGAR